MRRELGLYGVIAALLLGCSPSVPDDAPPSIPVSLRPREIDLKGVDPCGVVPDESVRLAGFDSGPRPETHPTFQSPSCRFHSTSRALELTVTSVLDVGFERFEPSKKIGEARSRTVRSFRALEFPAEGRCAVVVDVAGGQVLHVAYVNASGLAISEGVMCQLALDLADAAMRTLLAR
jgi:hypothetical protein